VVANCFAKLNQFLSLFLNSIIAPHLGRSFLILVVRVKRDGKGELFTPIKVGQSEYLLDER